MFLLTKAKNILIHPDKFFEDLKQENSIGLALLYYTTLYSISMIFSLLLVGIPLFSLSALMPSTSGYIAILFIAIYLIGILASFVVAGFLHVWAIIFGGKGSYTKTYQAYAYSVTPAFVFGWISSAVSIAMIFLELSSSYIFAFFLGLLLLIGTIGAFIYFILLLVKGIRKAHEVDTAKAALICISWIVYFIILFLLIVFSLIAISSIWMQSMMVGTVQNNQNVLGQNEILSQNVVINTVYQCGPDICFEIKALDTNSYNIPMGNTRYYLNELPKTIGAWNGIGSWDGGISGSSCIPMAILAPGQSCYGKILNTICTKNDVFNVSLASRVQVLKTITGCNSTDIF